MKINTTRFGEIEVDENLVFNFIEPILGYEDLEEYTFVDHSEDSPFKWLQSIKKPEVAFPVIFPLFFGIDYEFVIPEEEAKKLELTSSDNLLSLNIVCIPQGNPAGATVNLVGPIIINTINKKAMQFVLLNTNYSVKHELFPGGIGDLSAKPENTEVKS